MGTNLAWYLHPDPAVRDAEIAEAVEAQQVAEHTAQWQGTVYLLHFAIPLHHAQHYLGWTRCTLDWRLDTHRKGQGAKLLRAANDRGIEWWLVRTWPGVDRSVERRLKDRHATPRLCPLCDVQAFAHAVCPIPEHVWQPLQVLVGSQPGRDWHPLYQSGAYRCAVCQADGVCLGCRPPGDRLSPQLVRMRCPLHGGEGPHVQ